MVKFYEDITQNKMDLIDELKQEMNQGKPCAITIYHPYCIHCMNMKSSWKSMGENMQKKYRDDVNIAFIHMDCANEFPIDQGKIQGYPHIIYKSDNDEIEYDGPRDSNSFESWIVKNMNSSNKNSLNQISNLTNSLQDSIKNTIDENNTMNNNTSNISKNVANMNSLFTRSDESDIQNRVLRIPNSLQLYRKNDKNTKVKDNLSHKSKTTNAKKSSKKLKKSIKSRKVSTQKKPKYSSIKSKKSIKKSRKNPITATSKTRKTTKSTKKNESKSKSRSKNITNFHDLNTL